MPVSSIARPISPPSASISRTRWPFAVPPTAGLHGICATVSDESVQMATRAPKRAAAYAASHPAWPAPITMTSNDSFTGTTFNRRDRRVRREKASRSVSACSAYPAVASFADAEPREDMRKHLVAGASADNRFKRRARLLQISQHELFRQRAVVAHGGRPSTKQCSMRLLN